LSIAIAGELNYNLTIDEFKMMLLDELRPKKEVVVDEEGEVNDEENNESV
jgi:hypothetical protein